MIDALYTFSRSKYFICWRAEEAALVCAELAHFNAENQEFSRVTRYGYSVENLSHSDFALLLRSMEVEEVNHLLSKDSRGSHLLHFLSALENLPVSFSMSTARSDRRSFPLIYVNKEFEKLTGYKRMEVVGRNCKFLQDDVNNNAKDLNKLSRHLRRRKEITIILKNKRKDGTIFDNLVVIKPIYNEMGACDYVIAMQLDVTEERCTLPLPPYKYINQRLACMIPDHLEF
jgi:PAS domain S-box-containing protein